MEIFVKKTIELSEQEKNEILTLFNSVFHKDRTLTEFNNQFLNNEFGYSIHAFAVDEERIVGSMSYIPSYYVVNGKKMKFAIGADVMIEKSHRDFFCYYDILTACRRALFTDGFVVSFGFPNDVAYPIEIKGKLSKDVGQLDTYCLPYKIGGIKRSLRLFNWLSMFGCRAWLLICKTLSDKTIVQFAIHKDDESYNKTRYARLDGNYQCVHLDNLDFYYKIQEHESVRTAFLIDVTQKSAFNFVRAINYIVHKDCRNFDLILYVGRLPFRCNGLFKIPRKYEPKHFHMTCKVYDKSLSNDLIYNIDNWDVNLSNYDLI
jgi:hypothetical protein